MRVEFSKDPNGPNHKLCDAEVYFDADDGQGNESPFHGLKLVGFALWRSAEGDLFVTFPARAFGVGSERKYFDFLRSADPHDRGHVFRVKRWIQDEWQRREGKERHGD